MPTTWSDDFTTDHFMDGTYTYTPFGPVEGTDFTVNTGSGLLEVITTSFGAAWFDERTAQGPLPLQSTLTYAGTTDQGPTTMIFGFSDTALSNCILVAYYQDPARPGTGNMGILTFDPTDGEALTGQVPYTVAPGDVMGFNADSTTISVSVNGTVITSISTPPNLPAAIVATSIYPFVELQNFT